MENLLLAVISLVILVPIIYFLPLGLSSKGKILVIIISFFLANLGLLAQLSFPLWQTSLILLLLVFLSSIVIDSRLRKIIYPLSMKKIFHSHDEMTLDLIEREVDLENELPALQNAIEVSSRKTSNLVKIIASLSEMRTDDYREDVLIDEITPEVKIESLKKEVFQKQLSFEKDNLPEEVKLIEDSGEDFEEDISFLFNREELFKESFNGYTHQTQVKEEDLGYMSEIERMIAETDSSGQTENIELNLLNYQLEEVAATKEINNETSNITSLDNDEIQVLKLEKIEPRLETADSIEDDEPVIWEDVIEPIKIFKINNSNQGG
ncbi:hypothetical protein [Cytobacillus solani]|uniref:Uncharacterized protein n=1 Tax=Cytobacillus solani TaxID=1637975 RepID=A0A0Q3VIM3_9BACI|nr:hypothetical protein [Cytobacillus solani]KQL20687.1 hypothetical protein AN957_20225 [Cytobacillus solani]